MALPYIGLWLPNCCNGKLKARRRQLRKCLACIGPKRKDPAALRLPGPQVFRRCKVALHFVTVMIAQSFRAVGNLLLKPLPPIERMRPGPRRLRLEKPIARPDEVIGRHRIVRRIGDDAVPSDTPPSRLDRTHQSALKTASPMPLQHANSGEIAAISDMRGWNDAGKTDRFIAVIGQPPRPHLELRHCRRIQERQLVQIRQCIGDVVIRCVDITNSVHGSDRSQRMN